MAEDKKNLKSRIQKARNVFARLNKMFRDGPVVRASVSGKIETGFAKASLGHLLNSNVYNSTTFYSNAFDRMCLKMDTKIAVPDPEKFFTLAELMEKYPNGEKFIVYVYDHEKKKIVPAYAHHPRTTGERDTVKITFNDGSVLICTPDHPCMMRDGTFKNAGDLQPKDSMMPLYRYKQSKSYKTHKFIGNYYFIYSWDKRTKNGIQPEHKMIAEFVANRELQDDECVHHINHKKDNNSPKNLEIMLKTDHARLHCIIANSQHNSVAFSEKCSVSAIKSWVNDDGTRRAKLVEYNKRPDIIEKRRRFCLTDKNPVYRDDVKRKISEANAGERNGKYRHDLTEDAILQSAIKNNFVQKCVRKEFKVRWEIFIQRIHKWGYLNWADFVNKNVLCLNHKVISVEPNGIEVVGDLTVDGYENFATDSIIVHNSRYSDYSEMQYHAICSAAINTLADEAISYDEKGNVLRVISDNDKIKDLLETLFFDTLNIEFNMWGWVRSLCKWGDFFLLNQVDPEYGVVGVLPIPVQEVEKEEGYDPANPLATRYRWATQNKILNNWQVTHFRLAGDDTMWPYGTSALEGARRSWRQLILLEDAVMVYRIVRSPERRVFKIDVGNIHPDEVPAFMEKIKQTMKQDSVVDSTSGRVDQRYSALPLWKGTPIPLLDGRKLTLEEIAKEFEQGKKNWTYSIDDSTLKLKPGKIIWAGKNYSNAKLLKITLDNDAFIYSAPEHPFILRDGLIKRADELEINDSLISLYGRSISMGAEKDSDKMDVYEKDLLAETLKFITDNNGQPDHKKFDSIVSVSKIKSIETANFTDDVYCMTIVGPNGENDRHNFAVGTIDNDGKYHKNGVFVKNSVDQDFFVPVRGDTSSEIETLAGGQYTGDIDDLEYFKKKLISALQIPAAFLGYDEAVSSKCLHPDTKIPLLDGTTRTVRDLAQIFSGDCISRPDNLWVYSYDTTGNCFIPGKIVGAEQTRKNAKLVRVHVDNGEYIDCTPDHKFILLGGEEKEAQNLQSGESLLAGYRRFKKMANNASDYEQIYQPNNNTWQWTHKMVDESFNGKIVKNGFDKDGRFDRNSIIVVHHNDFNRFNNSPGNLHRMLLCEHIELHGNNNEHTIKKWIQAGIDYNQSPEGRLAGSIRAKKRMQARPELRYNIAKVWAGMPFEEKSRLMKQQWTPERRAEQSKINHDNHYVDAMLVGYKKKFPNGRPDLHREKSVVWVNRPTFEQTVEFIRQYCGDKNDINTILKLASAMGYSHNVMDDAISSWGWDRTEFMNEYTGFVRGRSQDLRWEKFVELSAGCRDRKDFMRKLGIGRLGLKSVLQRYGLDRDVWEKEFLGKTYNHKVAKVEWLNDPVDTYNIEISNAANSHNFLTSAGIVIKNSSLSSEDVRFSKTVQRIQRVIISELTKLAIIHLFIHGYDGEDLIDFDLKLTNPSNIAEQQKLELWRTRFEIAGNIPEGYFDREFVHKNIFQLSNREIAIIKQKRIEDKIEDLKLEQMQLPGEPPVGGAGGGGMGGGGGMEEPGPLGGGEEEGGEEPPGGGEAELFGVGGGGGGEEAGGGGGEERKVGGGGLFASKMVGGKLLVEDGDTAEDKDDKTDPRERSLDYHVKHNRQRKRRHGVDALSTSDLKNCADLNTVLYNRDKREELLGTIRDKKDDVAGMMDEERIRGMDAEVQKLLRELDVAMPRKKKLLGEAVEEKDNNKPTCKDDIKEEDIKNVNKTN